MAESMVNLVISSKTELNDVFFSIILRPDNLHIKEKGSEVKACLKELHQKKILTLLIKKSLNFLSRFLVFSIE